MKKTLCPLTCELSKCVYQISRSEIIIEKYTTSTPGVTLAWGWMEDGQKVIKVIEREKGIAFY
jgi:hypothetical protein